VRKISVILMFLFYVLRVLQKEVVITKLIFGLIDPLIVISVVILDLVKTHHQVQHVLVILVKKVFV